LISPSDTILDAIRELLRTRGVPFEERRHLPTATSEESAKARNEPLGVGAKALLLRTDNDFRLFVLSADRKLDSKKVKLQSAAKSVRFATPDELRELTGLTPGSVPPFGRPILPFELFADVDIGARFPKLAFNAGSLTDSIVMSAADWEAIAAPVRFEFSKL
jgi:prolyl-tRNA editing enzyme YbaK/EbsC (Cys-tRNA(Pro) deacylase)